ncbi:MAG: hemerythrin domain-containing protein [Bacteroidetes bacterium]|jgi:hemerythrin-like domain-containing protein|nr:hemerythrin domain-containing protein [Bacteroidota bacterium]
MKQQVSNTRRDFIGNTIKFTAASAFGLPLISAFKDDEEDKKVSPPEDLMQEHGLLNRILLIYDDCRHKMEMNQKFPAEALAKSAMIIRKFVEDYHEKQEENYLFPRFKKASKLTDLVDTLLKQHNAGRKLTDQVIQLTKSSNRTDTETRQLIQVLANFNHMYRPHEAREDTVLFPAFRKIVSQHEYDALGEEFENNEHKHFGKDGFESNVAKVAEIEKSLGIYDLSQFTPKVS